MITNFQQHLGTTKISGNSLGTGHSVAGARDYPCEVNNIGTQSFQSHTAQQTGVLGVNSAVLSWENFCNLALAVFVDVYMDKVSRNKATEGGSSDEEEAFESADEGEEASTTVKPTSATSADIRSANSTLTELVGKNDASPTSQVASGQEIKTGTAAERSQNTKMDSDTVESENEHEVENPAVEKDPSIISEHSPLPESETQEDTDQLNITTKVCEDEIETKRIEEDNGDTETDKQEVSAGEEQSPENEDELVAKENKLIGESNDDGQKEASENSANDQLKDISGSSSDVKVEDKPDR